MRVRHCVERQSPESMEAAENELMRKLRAPAIWALGADPDRRLRHALLQLQHSGAGHGGGIGARPSNGCSRRFRRRFSRRLLAPIAGRWADRFGAGRLMSRVGSPPPLALARLRARARAHRLRGGADRDGTRLVLRALQHRLCRASCRSARRGAQRSITHLTLIAGFASTLFWPLTALLHEHLTWREVYLVFAALNLRRLPADPRLACMRLSRHGARTCDGREHSPPTAIPNPLEPRRPWSPLFLLMLAGFAIEGFVLSADPAPYGAAARRHWAWERQACSLRALFGPSQVASRLINMLFGGGLRQTWLASRRDGAAGGRAGGAAPHLALDPGAVAFAILFGLGSGLTSIVGGTLPLELFGRDGYGARVGWITAARQFSSAFAPFGFALHDGRPRRLPGAVDRCRDRCGRHCRVRGDCRGARTFRKSRTSA